MTSISTKTVTQIAAIILLLLSIGACRLVEPAGQPESPLTFNSPLAASAPVQTLDLPTVSSESGQIYGRFVEESPAARVFLAGQLYLAPVVYGNKVQEEDPDVPFISLNVGVDPIADLRNDAGEFAFLDVPPGEYGLVLYTPVKSYLVPDSTGQSPLYLNIQAGEALGLDDIILK